MSSKVKLCLVSRSRLVPVTQIQANSDYVVPFRRSVRLTTIEYSACGQKKRHLFIIWDIINYSVANLPSYGQLFYLYSQVFIQSQQSISGEKAFL